MAERRAVDAVVAGSSPVAPPSARSSIGQSIGLRSRGLGVRVLPGAFFFLICPLPQNCIILRDGLGCLSFARPMFRNCYVEEKGGDWA